VGRIWDSIKATGIECEVLKILSLKMWSKFQGLSVCVLRVCCLHAPRVYVCMDLTVNSSVSRNIIRNTRPRQIYCVDFKSDVLTSNIPVERIPQFLRSREAVNSNLGHRIQITFLASFNIHSPSPFKHRSKMEKQATAASLFIFSFRHSVLL